MVNRPLREIICNIRDAVVSVVAVGDGSAQIQRGTGFFIKGHYIICPASIVLTSPNTSNTREEVVTNSDTSNTMEKIVTNSDASNTRKEVVTNSDAPNTRKEVVTNSDASNTREEVVTNSDASNAMEETRSSLGKSKTMEETRSSLGTSNTMEETRSSLGTSNAMEKAGLSLGTSNAMEETRSSLGKSNAMEKAGSFSECVAICIRVAVSNVNGSGMAYSYAANIIGLDAAANIAILVVPASESLPSPPIRECHPYLHWGKSRNMSPGDPIILIGDILATGSERVENGVVLGNLADTRYVSYSGSVPGELLLLSNVLNSSHKQVLGHQGIPVINEFGKVVGMTIHSTTSTPNLALSEFFMRRPVKALICSFIKKSIPERYRDFVELIPTPPHYRFKKAWLGISGHLMDQDIYLTPDRPAEIQPYPEQDLNKNQLEIEPYPEQDLNKNQLEIEPYPEQDLNKNQLEIEPCMDYEIVGYVVTHVDAGSPVLARIHPGDIITHINACPLGDRKGQISPALVMWRVAPKTSVTIRFKRRSENYNQPHEIEATTSNYNPQMDYPWYTQPLPPNFHHCLI